MPVGLLETFAPDEVDQRLKAGRPLDSLPVDELEQLARQHIGNQLHQAKGEEKMAEPEKSDDQPPEPDRKIACRQSGTFERDAGVLTGENGAAIFVGVERAMDKNIVCLYVNI